MKRKATVTFTVEIDDKQAFVEDWGDGESTDSAAMNEAIDGAFQSIAVDPPIGMDLTVESVDIK